jgi:hypothetical protein
MNRKALAIAIVLLIAGLAPASAIIGFCTRMPCCSHASSDMALAFSTERNDCCTTIACYESPSSKLATAPASADVLFGPPALVTVTSAPSSAALVAHPFADTSPPPQSSRHRLAILSTLLI